MNDFDEYDDAYADTPVTRLSPNLSRHEKLGAQILKQAVHDLEMITEAEHQVLIEHLDELAHEEPYFAILADELNQPIESKFANDALHLIYFWTRYYHTQDQQTDFDLRSLINDDIFQKELLTAFDALEIDEEIKAQRRLVILDCFKLYSLGIYSGCVPVLYAQLEGVLTDVLIATGYLKSSNTKFIDVYKIVPGLKNHEIKSLWHKSKIAAELNRYFLELNAYQMDSSSDLGLTRHNILHGTDLAHFHQGRSFVLFIWLFGAVSFMSTVRT